MSWYIPLTILPSLGLVIMSTSAQMMSLSSEIGQLVKVENCNDYKKIIDRKIKQLKRLVISLALLYTSSGCFTLAGLVQFIINVEASEKSAQIILGIGTFLFLFALLVLTQYAFIAVKIRQAQFMVHSKDDG